MDNVINFPSLDAREWAMWRDMLRKEYAQMHDGADTLDSILPEIQAVWEEMFSGVFPLTMTLCAHIDPPLTQEQEDAIKPACDACGKSLVSQVKEMRSKHFLLFVKREFGAAYRRRNGG
ncbi:MAG TPA: hypothetical protein DCK83_13625 [Gallionellaceae bacterium]|nr:hypothetical protein [Gallionellaceae bacterium]